eukprot:CAMPEP_0195155936 /NCGR_PEP_ID=MMETSP0448-20130528/184410_1 /TAXON_ID=66468 /ORGANISM="Heterocapsa triquestra, Strain CCMP 448" /LENGTH=47 /DNA_ID= /DNA_START= /DNA_END= /DNA_ORIENTATION=
MEPMSPDAFNHFTRSRRACAADSARPGARNETSGGPMKPSHPHPAKK